MEDCCRALARAHDLSPTQVRALRAIQKYPNLAFASRRLHVSQEALKSTISELIRKLGEDRLRLEDGVVHFSPKLLVEFGMQLGA